MINLIVKSIELNFRELKVIKYCIRVTNLEGSCLVEPLLDKHSKQKKITELQWPTSFAVEDTTDYSSSHHVVSLKRKTKYSL